MLVYKGTGHGSRMHLIAVDVRPVFKVGLSVCRVIDFKQRFVKISLLKLFALIFFSSPRGAVLNYAIKGNDRRMGSKKAWVRKGRAALRIHQASQLRWLVLA